MKQTLNGFICLCAILSSTTQAGVIDDVVLHGTKIAPHGQTTLSARSTGLDVRIVFETHEIDIGKPSDGMPKVKILPCTYSRYPCSPVERIAISVNGKALNVPLSVFHNLADVTAAKIVPGAKDITLAIVGGDASMSYIAKVQFDKEHVKSMTWASGMAPDKILEKTTYYNLPKDYFDH